MKIYITFGQNHAHHVNGVTFNKDSVAEIECKDHYHGRKIAFELFGDKFCTSYDNTKPTDVDYDPRKVFPAN